MSNGLRNLIMLIVLSLIVISQSKGTPKRNPSSVKVMVCQYYDKVTQSCADWEKR